MQKIQNTYTVIANKRLGPQLHRLSLDAPSIVDKVQPGQFVHLKTAAGLEPFFRRPFSVHRAKKYLEICYEVVGKGTTLLAGKKSGDALDVLGPLGQSFHMPPKGIERVVMIAGGIGIAPFLFLSDVLNKKGYELILLYGARTKNHIFPMKEFKSNHCCVFITTEDGSVGIKGRVNKLFSEIEFEPQKTMIYTCGPRPMMAVVQQFARDKNIAGEASCEEVMACGLGACLGCSIKTTKGFKTVCNDGPVFDLQDIIFENK
jgi:dihydroorotate dehydrogenase electron transfer subunit